MKRILLILSFLPLFSLAQGPTAFFYPPNITGCCDDPIFYDDMSMMGTSAIVSWMWDFGDGNISTSQFPFHIYSSPGSYAVSLTVTDANGLSDTFIGTATICCVTAAFIVTDPICLGDTAHFTDLTLIYPPPGLGSYFWDFGNGNTSTLQNPDHVYLNYGYYTVSLTVIDNFFGTQDNISQSVFVDSCTSTEVNNYILSKEILQVRDILGRETNPKRNKILFYIYNDGTVEKKIIIE